MCKVTRAVSTSTTSSSDWTMGDSPPSPGAGAASSVQRDGEGGCVACDSAGAGAGRAVSCCPIPDAGPAE